jgi:hypothetical protein
MVNSYVGIISGRGLESLVPETEHALPFLVRRAYRQRPSKAVCYWAVMQDEAAREIQSYLQRRRHDDALMALREQAAHFGTILPSQSDDGG